MTRILIVDDEPLYRHGLFELLRRPNLRGDASGDGDEALRLFRRGGYQLVISDLSMPGLDGLGLMRAVKRESPSTRFVILSGVGTIQAALTAVRQGADDFLEKPVSREQINEVVARVATPVTETGIVTANPTMLDRLERARRIAPTDPTRLVQGESGTGKEMVARAIHGWSARAAAPFVALNCAAMPDTLVEAELFGHERGAFTDARAARPGVIEQADGGTLFLDEIGEMPAAAQAKLLRVLQDECVRRLGATTTPGPSASARAPPPPGRPPPWPASPPPAGPPIPASPAGRSGCRRCASPRKTSRGSPSTSSAASAPSTAGRPRRSRRPRAAGCARTAGPATCASPRTRSTPPSSRPAAPTSKSPTPPSTRPSPPRSPTGISPAGRGTRASAS